MESHNNSFEEIVTKNHEDETEKVKKNMPYACNSAISIIAWSNLVSRKLRLFIGIEKDDEL